MGMACHAPTNCKNRWAKPAVFDSRGVDVGCRLLIGSLCFY